MLKFFDADPGWKKFGSGMEKMRIRGEKIRIRYKHPGSATLANREQNLAHREDTADLLKAETQKVHSSYSLILLTC